jgi:hypothetical protein
MTYPPYLLDMDIEPLEGKPVHIWLPLFLVWPLVLLVALVAFAVTIPLDVILFLGGQSYHKYSLLLWRCLELLTETSGMVIRVRDDRAVFDMTIV